jgi:hypothetical protein
MLFPENKTRQFFAKVTFLTKKPNLFFTGDINIFLKIPPGSPAGPEADGL